MVFLPGCGVLETHAAVPEWPFMDTVLSTGRAFRLNFRAASMFAPSQWQTSLRSNVVSHWLSSNLESAQDFINNILCCIETFWELIGSNGDCIYSFLNCNTCGSQCKKHYNDVIMGTIASQITRHTSVYSTVYSDADQRKHQSTASLAFVRGIHRSPVNWPVTRKMFPFDDVIM